MISLLFLLVSVGTYQLGTNYLAPTQTPVPVESPAGTWQQFVIDDGQPVYLATFTFVEEDGDYRVKANDVAPCTFPQSDFRTFAHVYSGDRWGFHSDWHEYGVAWFELERVEDNRFEGFAYLDGQRRPHRHILIRVE